MPTENHRNHSHPGQPVRHDYPLAIESANLTTAAGLLAKTLPYCMVRFAILFCLSLATIVWVTISFGGYLWIATTRAPLLAYPWVIFWVVAGSYLYWGIARYFLYLLKAGHIAVLTELITTGRIANGEQHMFEYGKNVVKERFGQITGLFALDLLIHGTVRVFNRTLDWVARLIPIPGLENVASVVNAVVRASTTYIDETLLSYNLARGDENVWRSSQDGLIYYAQNAREVLKTGVWIVVLDKVATFATWIVCLVPAFLMAYVLPQSLLLGGLLPFMLAVLFAFSLRAAFLEPLFLTMVMVKFHHEVRGQAIDTTWDARLSSLSEKFRSIRDHALGTPAGASQPVAVHGVPAE